MKRAESETQPLLFNFLIQQFQHFIELFFGITDGLVDNFPFPVENDIAGNGLSGKFAENFSLQIR